MSLGIPDINFGPNGGKIRVHFNDGSAVATGYVYDQFADGIFRVVSDAGDTVCTVTLAQDSGSATSPPPFVATILIDPFGLPTEHVASFNATTATTVEGHTYTWSRMTVTSPGNGKIETLPFSGKGAGIMPALTASASATYSPAGSAVGAALMPALTAQAIAVFTPAPITGTGAATMPALTASASASFTTSVELDFSDPNDSGYLALFAVGVSNVGQLDFSDPNDSGYLALLAVATPIVLQLDFSKSADSGYLTLFDDN